ncbi:MAG: phosphoribosylformylglycinamidine synthase subunit PurS [Candidatus Margulisbacteria bacterium]|jgi:phosphoribosylformylglycinamidine synthase|nr:phosphoribosylformylglycinamidine synthase subunit PurS [Candidatus Margulisiibacteriota bacterium]
MQYQVKMYVSYKDGILDPVGKTTAAALASLGYSNVGALAVGKYITFAIDAPSEDRARAQIKEMADKLLTNPVIEQYRFELGH